MIQNPQSNASGKEANTMATAAAPQPTGRFVKIAVTDQDGPRLLGFIAANRWPTRYLGNNIFVFSEQQAARINSEGIPFKVIAAEKE